MEITKVEIVPIHPKDGLIAFASLQYGDLYLTSIGVHKRLNAEGYRITYPTKMSGKISVTTVHPATPTLSKQIEEAITQKCKELFG